MRYALLMAAPLALLAAQPATPQSPSAINVQLSNFKFNPKTIVLNHGRPYVLRLQNASDGGHDFTAPEFFAAANVAPGDRKMVTGGKVEVHAGMVHEIHLTAPAAGTYKLKCTHNMHKFFGMSGKIVVR